MLVYLNGEWLPAQQAQVSAFDRGFIFGDGVYEVIPVYGTQPFRAEAHVARLQRSLQETRIEVDRDVPQWLDLLGHLGRQLEAKDGSIYLQVTRGASPRRHVFPNDVPPTVFGYALPHVAAPTAHLTEGVEATLLPDIRWQRCDIKSTSLIANVLLAQRAAEAGAAEALLIREGRVSEGATSNVFVGRNGRLHTAAAGNLILSGITRELMLELADSRGITVIEESPTVEELQAADEVLITSSTREILPVTRIDGQIVGDGRPGALFQTLNEALQDFKEAVRRGDAK